MCVNGMLEMFGMLTYPSNGALAQVLVLDAGDGDVVFLHDLEGYGDIGWGGDWACEDTGAESEDRDDGGELHFGWNGVLR